MQLKTQPKFYLVSVGFVRSMKQSMAQQVIQLASSAVSHETRSDDKRGLVTVRTAMGYMKGIFHSHGIMAHW